MNGQAFTEALEWAKEHRPEAYQLVQEDPEYWRDSLIRAFQNRKNGAEDTPEEIVIPAAEMERMAGRDLLEHAGYWTDKGTAKEAVKVQMKRHNGSAGPIMTVWQTRGRGRNANKHYVHVSWPVQFRIVTPDGTDTGDRTSGRIHVRGNALDKIAQYEEV